jgi:hypothetical protein
MMPNQQKASQTGKYPALRNQIFVLLHSLVQIFSFRNPGTAGLGVAFLHFLPLLHGGILAASALYLILIVTRV